MAYDLLLFNNKFLTSINISTDEYSNSNSEYLFVRRQMILSIDLQSMPLFLKAYLLHT